MHVCIVGGGLAGSLLAWRLARATGWAVVLARGGSGNADATERSGGAVRAYETDPQQRRLAVESMAELLASPSLREWADYRQVGAVYLGGTDGESAVAEIERAVPGSARLMSAGELAASGWAGVDPGATAVVERCAGYVSPGRLRSAALADGVSGGRMVVLDAPVETIAPTGRDTIACVAGGESAEYDLVVVAAGAWTARLLKANGMAAGGYRTRSIQYSVYSTGGWRPPHFVDGYTGLYGRPADGSGLLLGLPTDIWDVDPDHPPFTASLHHEVVRLARARFPKLRLGPAVRRVGSADCYADRPILALRPVPGISDRLLAFTSGAGGSAKTALAASRQAATQLIDSALWRTPTGGRR